MPQVSGRRPGAENDFRSAREGIRDCLDRLRALDGTLDERRATVMGLEGAAGRALGRAPADSAFGDFVRGGKGLV